MRVTVNEPLVTKRSSWGRHITVFGFAVMLLAVVLSFNRLNLLRAYGVMVTGLVIINIGLYYGGKWMRDPREDQILDKALKGLNHGSRLYSYLLPADHVLLSASGLFVLTLKFQDGQITAQGDKWQRHLSLVSSVRALFEPRLGNPGQQALKEASKVQSWVQGHLPDAEVPVRPVIVFVNPKAQLQLEEPSVPAVALDDLKTHLRTALKNKPLPPATLQALTDLCDEQGA
jgi:hypothetical protein